MAPVSLAYNSSFYQLTTPVIFRGCGIREETAYHLTEIAFNAAKGRLSAMKYMSFIFSRYHPNQTGTERAM